MSSSARRATWRWSAARRALGATTVAGTIHIAAAAGIRIMATGGIGGVHRDWEHSLDVSADLHELGRSGVAVVCSGAKIILDLPRTLEVLESLAVPVVGYRCDAFPAFYARDSGLPVPRLDEIARPREPGARAVAAGLAGRAGDRQPATRRPGAAHGAARGLDLRPRSTTPGRGASRARTRPRSSWRRWPG